MSNSLKVLLVVLSLAAGYEQYLARLAQLSTSSALAVALYVGLVSLLCLALFSAAFTRGNLLRWLYAIGFAGTAAFRDTNLRVTGQFQTYDMFVSEIDAFSFVNEAVSHYWRSITIAAALALPVRDRDMATVETLTALLADATAQFIYVNRHRVAVGVERQRCRLGAVPEFLSQHAPVVRSASSSAICSRQDGSTT